MVRVFYPPQPPGASRRMWTEMLVPLPTFLSGRKNASCGSQSVDRLPDLVAVKVFTSRYRSRISRAMGDGTDVYSRDGG